MVAAPAQSDTVQNEKGQVWEILVFSSEALQLL